MRILGSVGSSQPATRSLHPRCMLPFAILSTTTRTTPRHLVSFQKSKTPVPLQQQQLLIMHQILIENISGNPTRRTTMIQSFNSISFLHTFTSPQDIKKKKTVPPPPPPSPHPPFSLVTSSPTASPPLAGVASPSLPQLDHYYGKPTKTPTTKILSYSVSQTSPCMTL